MTAIENYLLKLQGGKRMGRAGGGSSGGSHSGGGHSGGHSSGGHRVGGGGSRAGSGSFSGGPSHHSGGFGGGHPHHGGGFHQPHPTRHGGGFHQPPPPPPPRHYRRYHTVSPVASAITYVFVFILITLFCIVPMISKGFGSSGTKSTIQRTKLESANAYINDCIVDELGWFDNTSKTSASLKSFWKKTGVQPFIVLHAYDATLTSDAEKEQWAKEYYDNNVTTENVFLFVYFAEQDADNDVGYMCYVNGYETSSIMDSEAIEIFWNYVDRYWYSDLSTDDMFVKVFDSEASTIMKVSTTGKDIVKWLIVLVIVIAGGITIIRVVKIKAARAKQKAEEDERILNTSIDDLIK